MCIRDSITTGIAETLVERCSIMYAHTHITAGIAEILVERSVLRNNTFFQLQGHQWKSCLVPTLCRKSMLPWEFHLSTSWPHPSCTPLAEVLQPTSCCHTEEWNAWLTHEVVIICLLWTAYVCYESAQSCRETFVPVLLVINKNQTLPEQIQINTQHDTIFKSLNIEN